MFFQRRSSRRRYEAYRGLPAAKDRDAAQMAAADVPRPTARSTTRSRSFGQLLREFVGLIAGHWGMLWLALAALTVSTLLGLAPLYGTKIVFDNVLGGHPVTTSLPQWVGAPSDRQVLLAFVACGMLGVSLASLAVGIWGRWQSTRTVKRVQVAVRRKVFDHAVRLPLNRVVDIKSGGVASILRDDAGGVAELIFSMIYNPWRAVVQLLGCLVILAVVDWRLLAGSFVLLPTVWLTHRTWINRIRPMFKDIRATRQQVDGHATETFGGMRVVRSFGRQQTEAIRFVGSNHLMARQELYAWWWLRGVDIAWSILIPGATALLLWYGGGRVLRDTARIEAGTLSVAESLTVGDLVMFLSYLTALLGPIATLAGSATALQNGLAGLDRVLDLLVEPREMPNRPGAAHVQRSKVEGQISLQGVSFAYPQSESLVIQDVSLDVLPGQMIALVGPSGAGKTTLCNLVARFFDPTAGAILLDGRDLRDINLDSYRRLLGVVEQDIFLFDGTVAANIGYGRRTATMQQIQWAAGQANAQEFIEQLADGYESLIGERGVKLSGGQRQRLAIARAIVADPRLLILDEATSNLDTETERLIQASLAALLAGRTSFVIAHRLSTITHADRIVVMERGRIVEQGRHDELMDRSGRYREMVDVQTQPVEKTEVEDVSRRAPV